MKILHGTSKIEQLEKQKKQNHQDLHFLLKLYVKNDIFKINFFSKNTFLFQKE